MKALFDGIPNMCPECGREFEWDRDNLFDYNEHCSFSCKCGFQYQLINWNVVKANLKQHLDSHITKE